MHASLWIPIGPNGILSLPLMSIRTWPPHSGLPRALLEIPWFYSFLCVCFCLFEMCQEEISTYKEAVLPFWYGSVLSALAFESALSCQESVKRDVGGIQTRSRELLRTQSFTLWDCVTWMSLLKLIILKKVQGSRVELSGKHVLCLCYRLVFHIILLFHS